MPGADDERGPESLPATPATGTGPTGEPLLDEFGQMTVTNGATEGGGGTGAAAGDADNVYAVPDEGHGSAANLPDTLEVDFNNAHAALPNNGWAHVPPALMALEPTVPSTTGGAPESWSPFGVNYAAAPSTANHPHAAPAHQQQQQYHFQEQYYGNTTGTAADQLDTQPAFAHNLAPAPSDIMQDYYFLNGSFSSLLFAPYPAAEQPNSSNSSNTHGGPEMPLLPVPHASYYNVTVPYGNDYAVHHAAHNTVGSISSYPPPASGGAGAGATPAPAAVPPPEPNPEPAAPTAFFALPALGHGALADNAVNMEIPLAMTLPVTFTTTAGLPMNNELSPTNADLKRFLMNWQASTRVNVRGTQTPRGPVPTVVPSSTGTQHLFHTEVDDITTSDLNGDHCDYQGIKWAAMGVTRREARTFRQRRYLNYCASNQDAWIVSSR